MNQTVTIEQRPRFLRNALVLGLLTAIGPFAIDMYLPSLPSIGASLNAGADAVLMSMTAFFATFALGHLVFGPASDMIGRKPPLYFGILIFIAASIGCAFATDIETLIAFRALQGLGGAAGIVIARAIVRDLHGGIDEARLLALLMLVLSVSPLFAPLLGSLLIEAASWRAVFWLVTGAAVIGLLLTASLVRETRPQHLRDDSSIGSVLAACGRLLTDRQFLSLTFTGSFAIASFFVFLAQSSFVLMDHYGLTPLAYSLSFSVNAAAFFAAMQFTGWLGARFGLARLVRPAVFGFAASMALLFTLAASGIDSLPVLGLVLFIGYGFVGILLPVTSVLALEAHGAIAGTASSLMGTLQLATGAVAMAISGAFADGSLMPMLAGIAGCAAMSLALALLAGRRAGQTSG